MVHCLASRGLQKHACFPLTVDRDSCRFSGADPAKFKGGGGVHTEVIRTKPQMGLVKKSTSPQKDWGGQSPFQSVQRYYINYYCTGILPLCSAFLVCVL